MTPAQWKAICDDITHRMLEYTRPYVTPLSSRTSAGFRKLEGSGSYVTYEDERLLLTCEHVERGNQLNQKVFDLTKDYAVANPFFAKPHPVDVAWSCVPDDMWFGIDHEAQEIPFSRFAVKHALFDKYEPLFFRGYAGENAYDDLVDFKAYASGYCSQEKDGAAASTQIFEMLWDPEKTSITSETSEEMREVMKFTDPRGFSGSLVWNTRYREVSQSGKEWDPFQAVVTGIASRYDPDTNTILVYRVEHIRAVLAAKPWV
jgi:hypothetical protein